MKNTCLSDIHFKNEYLPVDAYYGMDLEPWDKENRYFSFGNLQVVLREFNSPSQKWKLNLVATNKPVEGGSWAWPELHNNDWYWLCLIFYLPTDRAALRFLRMMEKHVQSYSTGTDRKNFTDFSDILRNEFAYVTAKIDRLCKQMGGYIASSECR